MCQKFCLLSFREGRQAMLILFPAIYTINIISIYLYFLYFCNMLFKIVFCFVMGSLQYNVNQGHHSTFPTHWYYSELGTITHTRTHTLRPFRGTSITLPYICLIIYTSDMNQLNTRLIHQPPDRETVSGRRWELQPNSPAKHDLSLSTQLSHTGCDWVESFPSCK